MITIAYSAGSVAPIVRRLVHADDRLTAAHDGELDPARLISAPSIQLPAPPDPLVALWQQLAQAATPVISNVPARSVRRAVEHLQEVTGLVLEAMQHPAPVAPPLIPREINVLVRWGSRWEGRADRVINTAQAVRTARDKRESRRLLHGICPATWFRSRDVQTPCIVRPKKHHAAAHFYVCNTGQAVERAMVRCGPGWYASAIIDKAHEYRVFVLQGRVVCVSERFPPAGTPTIGAGLAWNLAAGGRLVNVRRPDWPLPACKAAIEAARRVGLDWSAVDVAIDQRGRAVVFETNVSPALKNPHTIQCIAWALASTAQDTAPDHLDLSQDLTWSDLLHPSLRRHSAE